MKIKGLFPLILLVICSIHICLSLNEASVHRRKSVNRLEVLREELENITNSTHDHAHWENTSSVDWILETFDTNQDGSLDFEEFESYYSSIFPHSHDEHDEEDHEDHEDDEEHDEEHPECPSDEDLFNMWDLDHNGNLTDQELSFVSGDMLVMLQLGCGEEEEHDEDCDPPTTAQK